MLQKSVFEKMWNLIDKDKDFSYLTEKEFRNFLRTKEYPLEVEKRKEFCIFYDKDNDMHFNYDKRLLKQIGITELDYSMDELKGTAVYLGSAKGAVKIINKPQDMNKFKQGDIIVSVNTTPSLMPILTKCKAIITDEGGLTCHASILSRELKIPCIVGTKIATKILKDGDLVEVDAINGIVRLIERS